jgi:hypothetical protein
MVLYRLGWVALIGAAVFFAATVGWQQVRGGDDDPPADGTSVGDMLRPGATKKPDSTPTATSTPTPTPTPPVLARCKGDETGRGAVEAGTAVATPAVQLATVTPTPTVTTSGLDNGTPGSGLGTEPAGTATVTPTPTPTPRDIDPSSILHNCMVVTYYGHPWDGALGVLARIPDRDQMIAQLEQEAAAFDAANGDQQVVAGFHLIYAVAQADPQPDNSYLARMPDDVVQEWIDIAEQHDFVVYLDIQMGHSTVEAELPHVLKFLKNPRVHLALDPEWSMPDGVPPGSQIGSMDASEINRAQEMMQKYILENGLENRMLVVHQFTESMITNKEQLVDYPDVDLIIDMDGWGAPETKIEHYDAYVVQDGAEFRGFKLFYLLDTPMLTAAEVMSMLPAPPDYIMYQ